MVHDETQFLQVSYHWDQNFDHCDFMYLYFYGERFALEGEIFLSVKIFPYIMYGTVLAAKTIPKLKKIEFSPTEYFETFRVGKFGWGDTYPR